jgi:enamine deaminase RidA (YjgF/YER057c/UK114 family)
LNLLKAVLATARSDFTKLLKVNIYLTNRADFSAMNAVCTLFFLLSNQSDNYIDASADISMIPEPRPARICVTVSELGLGAKVSPATCGELLHEI